MSEDAGKDMPLTDFDYLLADPHLQMIKSIIPYMQPNGQRMLSMMIKLQELNRVRTLFSEGEVSAMGLTPPGTKKSSPMEILQTIKPFASPREREFIETVENLQIMVQAMQMPT